MRSWRNDAGTALLVVVALVLCGAPAGLLWAWIAPRYTLDVQASGVQTPDLESSKAFIGADGSYLIVMIAFGVLCGAAAWLLARRAGPWTVVALVLGGGLAALIAAQVGLMPGTDRAIAALRPGTSIRGQVPLFLGALQGHTPHLRAPLAAVGWPVAAVLAFLVGAWNRPEQLD